MIVLLSLCLNVSKDTKKLIWGIWLLQMSEVLNKATIIPEQIMLFFSYNTGKAMCVEGEQIARVSHIWFLIARLKEENSVFEFSI